jgi:signal transduction histidine kinase
MRATSIKFEIFAIITYKAQNFWWTSVDAVYVNYKPDLRCVNMNYSSRQRFDEISKLRFDGNLSVAIERCRDAISAYPEDNFFYKVLGDLYFQEKNYVTASQAYLEHLKRLSKKPEHFKAFARFYRQFTSEASEDLCVHFREEIIKAIEDGEIASNIHQLLMETFGDVFVIDDHLKTIFCMSDSDRHLEEIKEFVETASTDDVRSVIFYQMRQEKYCANTKIKEYLISVAEKKTLYSEAQQLVGKIIAKQKSPNPTLIRTLLRMSRKQQDYHYAEQLLSIDEVLVEKSDFNIQYELVYYFDSTGKSELLSKTLKKMRSSAERSIPIARTLYNFYLTFDRFEDAQILSEHIQKLIDRKRTESKKNQDQDRSEEQLESEQIVWQRVKDLVSEKEHNRQMLALRDLLKGFSHELGQPITNIRYKIQLQQLRIKRGIGTMDEVQDLFDTILAQTERIGVMLDRFRPIVSSKSVQESFCVNDCVRQVFVDLSDRLSQCGITYSFQETSQISLFGDRIQFSQVFYNLVLNSMQAILGNGKITVSITTVRNSIRILFSDNGPGIPEENRKKIFEPFFSTKDPTSGNGGEGLGLFVVWNILKMYKGTIQLNHKYKNGAQFIIKIPIKEENHEPSSNN